MKPDVVLSVSLAHMNTTSIQYWKSCFVYFVNGGGMASGGMKQSETVSYIYQNFSFLEDLVFNRLLTVSALMSC